MPAATDSVISVRRRPRIAELLLLFALAASARGRQADQSRKFEVSGISFQNRSLGYDQQAPGVLGQQCAPARPGRHPDATLTYTANRRCCGPLRRCPLHASAAGTAQHMPMATVACTTAAVPWPARGMGFGRQHRQGERPPQGVLKERPSATRGA